MIKSNQIKLKISFYFIYVRHLTVKRLTISLLCNIAGDVPLVPLKVLVRELKTIITTFINTTFINFDFYTRKSINDQPHIQKDGR